MNLSEGIYRSRIQKRGLKIPIRVFLEKIWQDSIYIPIIPQSMLHSTPLCYGKWISLVAN